jgi:hypothetical protein
VPDEGWGGGGVTVLALTPRLDASPQHLPLRVWPESSVSATTAVVLSVFLQPPLRMILGALKGLLNALLSTEHAGAFLW